MNIWTNSDDLTPTHHCSISNQRFQKEKEKYKEFLLLNLIPNMNKLIKQIP